MGDVVPERAAHPGARMASLVEVVHEDPPQQPRRAPPPVRVAEPLQRIVDGVVGHLPADHPHPRILAAEQGAQRLEQLLLRLHAERGALVVPHVLGVRLKHPFGDATTHVVLDPIDFIARLAALVPRPRAHLTRYRGVFAPNFKHRHRIIPNPAHRTARKPHADRPAPMSWMQRLKRVFHIDIEHCGVGGATLRVIACIETPEVIERILAHLAARNTGGIDHHPRAPPLRALSSRTPRLPIPDAVLTAPAGAPQPRCASPPAPPGPHRLPDMLS